jgi:putative endonuclease
MNKKIIGNWGENLAKEYLERKGYRIIETNWRFKKKELDLIVYKKIIIGIEIKTRSNMEGLSFTVLKAEQVARLRLAMRAYCQKYSLNYQETRLDLITITIKNKNTALLKHSLDI